jgi:signal transduction histidine kinase
MAALIDEAMDLVRPIATKSSIRSGPNWPRNAEVWCDSEAVSQILSNLLDNAIKYTPAGGIIVAGARPAGRFVEVYVRDSRSRHSGGGFAAPVRAVLPRG